MNAVAPNLSLVVVAGFLIATGVYLLLERALTRLLLGFPDLRLTPDGLVFAHAVPPFAAGALLPAQQWVGGGLCLSLCLLEAADTP